MSCWYFQQLKWHRAGVNSPKQQYGVSQRLMASVFIHQPSTFIKAGIHHQRSRDWKFPSVGCSQKFHLHFSSPLSAFIVLIFLVPTLSCFEIRLLRQKGGSDRLSGNIKMFFVTFLPENPGDTWTCWETDRQPAVQQHLICHRPAVSPSYSTSKSIKTSGNCSSIIVSQSTAELRLFNRRLLGMTINAPGCQQALPRNMKKTRITPGALLRKGIYHLLHCSSCYTAASNYSPSCVHRRSNLPGRLIEKYCQYSCE